MLFRSLKEGHTWSASGGLSSQWTARDATTFHKQNAADISQGLTQFDYPVSISVTVVGDPDTTTVNITSEAEVFFVRAGVPEKPDERARVYRAKLNADVVKSFTGEFHIVKMRDL